MALKLNQKTVGNAFQLKFDAAGNVQTITRDEKVAAALEHDIATAGAIEGAIGDPSSPETLAKLDVLNRDRDQASQITPEALGEMKTVLQRAPTSFENVFESLGDVSLTDTVSLLKEDISMVIDVSTPDEIAELLEGDGLPSGYFDAASYIAQLNVVYPFVAAPPVPKMVETGVQIDKTSDLSELAIASGAAVVGSVELAGYLSDAAVDIAFKPVEAATDCLVDVAEGVGKAAGSLLDGLFGGGGIGKWLLLGVAGAGAVVTIKLVADKKKRSAASGQSARASDVMEGVVND